MRVSRSLLLAAAVLLLSAGRSEASWTFVISCGGGGSGSVTSQATAACAGTHVGDLVAVQVKWEGGDTTVTCSNSSTASTWVDAFAGAHVTDANAATVTMCYTLALVPSGSLTFTATFGAARTFTDVGAMVYTPSAAAATDGGHQAIGTSATVNSGNITTTGTDGVAFGGFGETGAGVTIAGCAINSVTRDQVLQFGSGPRSAIWSKSYAAGFTGAATCAFASGGAWNAGVVAFKISGGAPPTAKRLTTLGAGE